MEGTKIPAGTLHPYDTMTSNVRMNVASKREFTIRHCADDLEEGERWGQISKTVLLSTPHLLAQMLKVTPILALAEEDGHAFGHVDSQKSIGVADHRGYSG